MAESSRKQRRPAITSNLSGILPSSISAPHSEEAEQALLGICILEGGDYINDCLKAKVAPDSFYQGRNQILFETLTEVYHKRQALDSTLLIDALREKDQLETVGGLAYIIQLMDRITTVTHFGHYLDIVCEKATLRRLIRTCSWIVEECHKQENGIDHFVGKVEEEIFRV